MMTEAQLKAIEAAEAEIQEILLDLDVEVGKIAHVNIDTRNFANYRVEIFTEAAE